MARFLNIFVIAVIFVSQCESARILGLFPAESKSHIIVHTSVIDALAEKGHDVTVVTTIPILKKDKKYRHIQLEVGARNPSNHGKLINDPGPNYKKFERLVTQVMYVANSSLNHPTFKQLMGTESFDLVILGYFFNEFQLGVAGHFKCPIILSFMNQPIAFTNKVLGNPREVAYVPDLIFGGKQPLDFWGRLKNLVVTTLSDEILTPWMMKSKQKALYDANFPAEKYQSFDEMKKNVSLVFVNHHFSQGPIRPNVPAMVEIGGIQIKEKTAPLPEDLKQILDNAKDGLVYFSFGSNVQGKFLDKVKAKLMFDVLSKLKQTVLWKWDDSPPPGQSPNIHYRTWLPQDDILAHPNVRLFITHGGAGGTVESTYHGVPMVGIPLFAEQHTNVGNLVKNGYGVGLEFATITVEKFESKVNEVLTNPVYRNNIQRFSKLYKDRPMTAKQTVVYWTEYVLRHHGAAHMQSPAVHMNSFQLASLDVIGFILAVIYIVYEVSKVMILFIWSKLFSKTNTNSKIRKSEINFE